MPREPDSGALIVPWRSVALGATLVAISALAALIVAVAIGEEDALSTVALALAILAFVVQIMVFIAQSWTGSQQTARSQEIYSQTETALAELKTRAAGTEAILAKQVDNAMRWAFEKSLVESRKSDLSFDEALEEFEQAYEAEPDEPPTQPEPSEEDSRIADELTTYPTEEEAQPLLEPFLALSPIAASTLRVLGEDERDSRRGGFPPGVGAKAADSPGVLELIDAGLAEFDPDWDDRNAELRAAGTPVQLDDAGEPTRRLRLTRDGRQVARLFVGKGRVPDYLADAVRRDK